jgi:hypothetical protein
MEQTQSKYYTWDDVIKEFNRTYNNHHLPFTDYLKKYYHAPLKKEENKNKENI